MRFNGICIGAQIVRFLQRDTKTRQKFDAETLRDAWRQCVPMSTRARVLAAILLCPLAAVTLPSCGATSKVSKVAAGPSREESPFPNTSGDTAPQTEKLDLRVESAPQDSLVKIAYWIPEMVNRDSVFIDLDCFNMGGTLVAQLVNKTHAPGSYTVFLSKRGLPDGIYNVRLSANRLLPQREIRPFNLIWTNRK